MPETKRRLKVFLCHASADKPKVRELYRYLRRRGVTPWFDEMDLVGGQDWQVEIPKAISTADAIIICLTKNSVDREGYVQREIKFALDKALDIPEGRIFIIPVRFEECEVPSTLSRFQWVDLFDDAGYTRMMRALKFRATQLERANVQVLSQDAEEEKLALEKAKREEQEREEAEIAAEKKAAQEKLEREETQRAGKEEAERKATEKAELEKAKREAAEKARRERAERRTAQFTLIKENFAKSFNKIRLARYRAKPFLQIAGIIGTVLVLFWIGSWAMSQFPSFAPTATSGSTLRPSVTITFTISPAALTSTQRPNSPSTKTRTPAPTPLPNQITGANGVQMVLVPAGEFTMGSETGDADEKPVHQVYLDDFYMDKFEVTNALYKACVDAGECSEPFFRPYIIGITPITTPLHEDPYYREHPVSYVNKQQAVAYCEWRGARLPTEAEWEKAARGRDGRTYPWGEELGCSKANYVGCQGRTTPVGSYEEGKSPYGIYDMAGNVWELVADWYSSDYYQYSLSSNPLGPSSGDFAVVRGGPSGNGSIYDSSVRASNRVKYEVGETSYLVGFRCARSVP